MLFTHLKLENWRNFLTVDVPLGSRVFLVGPNAAGKSNLLDAFRFLRDVADPQGGFLRAVRARGGVSQIRSLHARRYPNVAIEVEVDLAGSPGWRYRLEFTQTNQRQPLIRRERIQEGDEVLLDRPDRRDQEDEALLSQTHLEQVNANRRFRELQEFFSKVQYLHIVPQLVRDPSRSVGLSRDPFGGDFLEQIARTPKSTQESRLRKIAEALQVAVPQLAALKLDRDERGVPHLKGLYKHWRPQAGWQTEERFSDGTLRLLGLLWVFLDGTAPLLLEEPELSLHSEVVRYIPSIMARLARRRGRQVLVSTHSESLLRDEGIGAEEVLKLEPTQEDTKVTVAGADGQIRILMENGETVADAVLPRTAPLGVEQLVRFGE